MAASWDVFGDEQKAADGGASGLGLLVVEADTCHFLSAEKYRFRFSFQPNLNKLLADRRASVPANAIRERVRAEIEKVFALPAGRQVERVYFPERTNQVPDRAALTLIVLAPEVDAEEVGRLHHGSDHAPGGGPYRCRDMVCARSPAHVLHPPLPIEAEVFHHVPHLPVGGATQHPEHRVVRASFAAANNSANSSINRL